MRIENILESPGIEQIEQEAHLDVSTGLHIQEGTVLKSRYVLDQWLGAGGMGVVYRARDLAQAGRFVALKLLNRAFANASHCLDAWQEWIHALSTMQGTVWAKIEALEQDPAHGVAFVVMEYVPGRTLQTFLSESHAPLITWETSYRLIAQMATGLAIAHQTGMVHGDLKPSNVLVTPQGDIKLIDFGWVAALHMPWGSGDDTEVTRFDVSHLGAFTPAYASYEVLMGGKPQAADDLYALACMAYALLKGHHPFGKLNAVTAKSRGLHPPMVPGLPRAVKRILRHYLHFDQKTPSETVPGRAARRFAAVFHKAWQQTQRRQRIQHRRTQIVHGLRYVAHQVAIGTLIAGVGYGAWWIAGQPGRATWAPLLAPWGKMVHGTLHTAQQHVSVWTQHAVAWGRERWFGLFFPASAEQQNRVRQWPVTPLDFGVHFTPAHQEEAWTWYVHWITRALEKQDVSHAFAWAEQGLALFPGDPTLESLRQQAWVGVGQSRLQAAYTTSKSWPAVRWQDRDPGRRLQAMPAYLFPVTKPPRDIPPLAQTATVQPAARAAAPAKKPTPAPVAIHPAAEAPPDPCLGQTLCADPLTDGIRGPELVRVPGIAMGTLWSRYPVTWKDRNLYCRISQRCPEMRAQGTDQPVPVTSWLQDVGSVVGHYNVFCQQSRQCEGIADPADYAPWTGYSPEEQAQYIEWLHARTGHIYRVPTQAEWSHALTGPLPAGSIADHTARRLNNILSAPSGVGYWMGLGEWYQADRQLRVLKIIPDLQKRGTEGTVRFQPKLGAQEPIGFHLIRE